MLRIFTFFLKKINVWNTEKSPEIVTQAMPGINLLLYPQVFSKWELTSGRTWGTAGKSQRSQAVAGRKRRPAVGCATGGNRGRRSGKTSAGKKKKLGGAEREGGGRGPGDGVECADLAQSCGLTEARLLRWNAALGIRHRHHILHRNPRRGSLESPKSAHCGPVCGPRLPIAAAALWSVTPASSSQPMAYNHLLCLPTLPFPRLNAAV